MGVLTDYFRAPDAAAVEHVMREDTVSPIDRDPGYDGVALKGVDDVVLLGKLVTAITGTEWAPGLTGSVPIYPPADTRPDGAGGWAELPADSPWVTGPWVSEIADHTRHVLASMDLERIASVAAYWARADEFGGSLDQETAEQMIGDLRALAQRATQAYEHLYCWKSL